jgi:hypothetical protein
MGWAGLPLLCDERPCTEKKASNDKPLYLPIEIVEKTVYELKIPAMERFIKACMRLKDSKRVCHPLHFDKPFLRVDEIPKPIIFIIDIRL